MTDPLDLSDPLIHAKFDLFQTRFKDGDWFTCYLYRLLDRADPNNRERLRRGFPLQVQVWEDWYEAPNEREFFKEFLEKEKV